MQVLLKWCVKKINNCKTGISKKDGCNYKFEYVNKEELPTNQKTSSPEMFSEYQKEKYH